MDTLLTEPYTLWALGVGEAHVAVVGSLARDIVLGGNPTELIVHIGILPQAYSILRKTGLLSCEEFSGVGLHTKLTISQPPWSSVGTVDKGLLKDATAIFIHKSSHKTARGFARAVAKKQLINLNQVAIVLNNKEWVFTEEFVDGVNTKAIRTSPLCAKFAAVELNEKYPNLSCEFHDPPEYTITAPAVLGVPPSSTASPSSATLKPISADASAEYAEVFEVNASLRETFNV